MPPTAPPPAKDPPPEEKAEDSIPQERKETRRQKAEEWFHQQVERTIADNQAAAEAAAAARAERAAASEAAAAAVRAEEAWRRNMLRMRSEVDARMKALTLLKEQREEEEENRSQMFRTAGMRLPKIVTVLPIVLLYHTETLSFAQRHFVEQVTHVLRAAGLKVWWDRGQGVDASPDRLHYRMEAANRAEVVVVVGSADYYASPEFADEARLLYSRAVGGFANGVENLQVLHIPFDDAAVPEEWAGGEAGLSFATHCVQLPPAEYGAGSWVQRVHAAACKIGRSASRLLPDQAQFFLQLASANTAEARLAKGWKVDLGAWRTANDLDPKLRLHPFQMKPLSCWDREDMLLAFSYLGASVQPSCQRLADLGMTGWLLDASNESILEEAGIASPHHRQDIMRLLDVHLDPTRPGSAMDINAMPLENLGREALAEQVHNMFVLGDRDGNGMLDPKEFKEVLRANRLELTKREMRKIMSEVDQDDNGAIDYNEFFPVMIELIEGMKARHSAQQHIERNTAGIKDQALQQISGLTQEELEFKLRTLFHIADEDNNGYLTRGEVRKCLESQDLHFTRAQVNVLMAEMEDDHSGRLTYEDFVPLALTLLVEMTEQQLEAEELTEQAQGVQHLLNGAFKQLEAAGLASNARVQTDIAEALLTCLAWERVLDLSPLQIMTIIRSADPGKHGRVHCVRFALTAARMIDAYGVVLGDSRNPTPYRDKRKLSTIGAKNQNTRVLKPLDDTAMVLHLETEEEEDRISAQHSGSLMRPGRAAPLLVQPSFLATKSGLVCSPAAPAEVHTGVLSPATLMHRYDGQPRTIHAFGSTKVPSLPDKVYGARQTA